MINQLPKPVQGIACECGGVFKPATLEKYDFSDYVGFEVILTGFEGLKCDRCGEETLDGRLINAVLNYTLFRVASQPRRLSGPEAKYLRHSLHVTQEELATRIGIVRETVAKWECGDTHISPQHDFVLRTITLAMMISKGLLPAEIARQIMADTFVSVRAEPPRSTSTIDVDQVVVNQIRVLAEQHAAQGLRAAAG